MPTSGHMVVPWEEKIHLTPVHRIQRAQVWLDPEHAHWMSGKSGERDLMLSKTQLEAISEAAGIEFIESSPLPTEHPAKIVWQVRGVIEGADGKKKEIVRTYPLDMRTKERDGVDGGYILLARQRQREKYEKTKRYKNNPSGDQPPLSNEKAWEEYIERKAMADWTMTFRHAESRAETGAQLRIIRSKCRIRNTYQEKEFEQPCVVYRAEVDVTRALQAGGPMAEMAFKLMGAAMTRSFGLTETAVAGLLEGVTTAGNGVVEQEDLLNATDKEIEDLEKINSKIHNLKING